MHTRLFIQRAENEITVARVLFKLSEHESIQSQLGLEKKYTFYSSVISHAYYCIFYCAKAILIREGIETDAPEVHRKTLRAFEKYLVETGKLDVELLKIYKKMVVRAEELLGIFEKEKAKRGEFTYQKLPQANKEPARESLDNGLFFFRHINNMI